MRCIADLHYIVEHDWADHQTNRWWLKDQGEEPNGDIRALKCAFCDFRISKWQVGQPRSSTSGLGRYNRMRGCMVAHLHEKHRDQL